MTFEKTIALAIIPNEEERVAIETVDSMLRTLQNAGGGMRLISAETGEIVDINELARIRGIITAFIQNRCWTVELAV
jgi:hypothetical protein